MGMIEEVGLYLADPSRNLGLVAGTNLFYGQRPDAPDDCLTLYEYQGEEPEFDHGSTIPEWEVPRLQLVARSFDPLTARNQVRAAYLALTPIASSGNQALIDDQNRRTTYRGMRPLQQPFQLGRDENRRFLWAVNFRCIRRPQPDL